MSSPKIKLDEIFDVAILRHGFHSNNRDYFFLIETNWTEGKAGQYILKFKDCFELTYEVKHKDFENLDWDGNWTLAYPGFKDIPNNNETKSWEKGSGIRLYSVELETEIYRMKFIYSEYGLQKINNNDSLINKAFFYP
ncbi:hypothetical protein OZ410_09255 [Robiginitalea sp. M366]|uniref:YxiG-like protein n=1 Tax=Robiginitalea aestuariiviva TaxID=3036903 RepID=UPI00240E1A9A|nr:hypothetical protein [Robiginitalea aestuariiviva]MDG1572502.1 hypothetical protein [Robiginitalea aestuariiviva]